MSEVKEQIRKELERAVRGGQYFLVINLRGVDSAKYDHLTGLCRSYGECHPIVNIIQYQLVYRGTKTGAEDFLVMLMAEAERLDLSGAFRQKIAEIQTVVKIGAPPSAFCPPKPPDETISTNVWRQPGKEVM
jgi:hypothetical protein